ncbi:MAG: transporter substrate-binding domain-containing protein [Burkholderiaceae bacterium]|jgi:polar amino acid transport system substrate-binding protein|nr:transporter substrate-binding domain-containing protein [Burkholderiaceae bacterium]
MLSLRKPLVLAFGLAVVMSLLAGCSSDKADKKYAIATDTTFAPFEYTDSKGAFVGADLDILAAIAKDQNFQYDLRPLGFDAAVAALESNQADGVIAGMSITDKRKEKYNFSDPYYNSHIVVAVAAGNDAIKSYADLGNKTVAAKTGTEGAKYAESLAPKYHFKIHYFTDSPTMYEDVKTGNSVACFEDSPVMAYGISQNNGLKIVNDSNEKSPGSSYGFAVMKNNEANQKLLAMFQAGLANIKKNGQLKAIMDKYNLNYDF